MNGILRGGGGEGERKQLQQLEIIPIREAIVEFEINPFHGLDNLHSKFQYFIVPLNVINPIINCPLCLCNIPTYLFRETKDVVLKVE